MSKVRMAIAAAAALACQGSAVSSASADQLVATQPDSRYLYYFDSEGPENVDRKSLSGLDTGEDVLGLDVRPATGVLYVLGDHGNLYVVNTVANTAQKVASLPTALDAADRNVQFAVDFNPVTDRLRIVSTDDANYSVDPNTGAVTVEGKIQYDQDDDSPTVVAAAYTLPAPGQNTTTLYAVDARRRGLYQIGSPASGVLSHRDARTLDVDRGAGLDIGSNNDGFLVTTVNGRTRLFALDVSTGDLQESTDLDQRDRKIGSAGLNGVATLNVAVRGVTGPLTPPAPPAAP